MLPNHPFVAVLLSSAKTLTLADGSSIATGVWAEEVLLAWKELRTAGWPLLFITPDGEAAQIDPQSLRLENLDNNHEKLAFLREETALLPLDQHLSIAALQPFLPSLRGVFIPGGNGPLMDLATSSAVAELLSFCRQHELPVATLCHGAAALLARPGPEQDRPFAGFAVSCFQKREEEQTSLAGRWPYHLEEYLRDAGFTVVRGKPWQAQIAEDCQLCSGQNPASAIPLARLFLQRLEENRRYRGSKHGY